jgi:hypothetical protein
MSNRDDAEAYRLLQAETLIRAYAVLQALEELESDAFLNSDGRVKRLNAALKAQPIAPELAMPVLAELETYVVGRKWGANKTIEDVTAWFAARRLTGQ